MSRCGKICKTPPKCIRNKRGRDFYSRCSFGTMSWRRCESESSLFGLPKEETTRNQWLSCIYNTVPEQYNPNIRVCAAHFTEDYFLNLGVACQLCTKAVSIKWGNSNFARTVWRFLLTACKYVFLFKEFATDYSKSNTSFEQCRVVLVVCHFSDHKCRRGNVYKHYHVCICDILNILKKTV